MSKAKSILSKSFTENIRDLNEDQLSELIVKAEIKIRQLKEEQANDEKLHAAQQIAKDLNAGYNSIVKMEREKINYLLEQVEAIQDGTVNQNASV